MQDGLKRGCAGWAKRDCSVGSEEGLCRMGQRGTVQDGPKRDCAGCTEEGLCGMG